MGSRAGVSAGSLLAGRYRLVEPLPELGVRGWRAHDDIGDREVAAREIPLAPGLADDEQDAVRRRTVLEARTAARLHHDGVVPVYDVVEHDGVPWVVAEFVQAPSLDHVLRTRGPVAPTEAARIGLRILDALEAAHAVGVHHRDLTPANVLLGQDGEVVVAGFGLTPELPEPSADHPRPVAGSADFVAPERARGMAAAGMESDLWSLGATLYAAVEGALPFHREATPATLTAVVSDEPPQPRRAGALRPVLEGLLVKDPAHRMDAADVRRMLDDVVRRAPAGAAAGPAQPAEQPAVAGTVEIHDPEVAAALATFEAALRAATRRPAPPADPGAAPPAGPNQRPGGASAAPTPTGEADAGRGGPPAPTDSGPSPVPDATAAPPAPTGAPPGQDTGVPTSEDGVTAGAGAPAAGQAAAAPTPPGTPARPSSGTDRTAAPPTPPGTPAGPASAAALAGWPSTDRAAGRPPGAPQPAPEAGRPAAERQDAAPPAASRPPTSAKQPDPRSAPGAAATAGPPVRTGHPSQAEPGARPPVPGAPLRTPAGPTFPGPRSDPRTEELAGAGGARSRRQPLVTLTAVVLVVLAAVLVPYLLSRTDDPARSGNPVAAEPSPSTEAPGAATPASGSVTAAPPPPGFRLHRDPTGFSIAVPVGWREERDGVLVDFRDPTSSRFIRIDQRPDPRSDPYVDWLRQEPSLKERFPGYDLKRIDVVQYRGWPTADWEFTWGMPGSERTHVLNRNVVPHADRGYALYWSTADELWDKDLPLFETFASTFSPAQEGR